MTGDVALLECLGSVPSTGGGKNKSPKEEQRKKRKSDWASGGTHATTKVGKERYYRRVWLCDSWSTRWKGE